MSAAADIRGLKRICTSCETRFYDMNKRPVVCPSCGTEFSGEPKVKSRRSKSSTTTEKLKKEIKSPTKGQVDDDNLDDEDDLEDEEDIGVKDVSFDDDDHDLDDSNSDDDDSSGVDLNAIEGGDLDDLEDMDEVTPDEDLDDLE